MQALNSNEEDEMFKNGLPYVMECLEAHGLSLEKIEENMENPPDGYYCFLDCFYKKLKIVSIYFKEQ